MDNISSLLPSQFELMFDSVSIRKDMDQLPIKDNGAMFLVSIDVTGETSLNISCLAAANGPTSDCSTHRDSCLRRSQDLACTITRNIRRLHK
jgi:hypothetical protein